VEKSSKTTTTTLTAAPKSSVFGQSVTFVAVVKSTAGGTPGGSVNFRDGSTDLGSVAIVGGKASLKTAQAECGHAQNHGHLPGQRRLRREHVEAGE